MRLTICPSVPLSIYQWIARPIYLSIYQPFSVKRPVDTALVQCGRDELRPVAASSGVRAPRPALAGWPADRDPSQV